MENEMEKNDEQIVPRKKLSKGFVLLIVAAVLIIGGIAVCVVINLNKGGELYRTIKVLELEGISKVNRQDTSEFDAFAGLLLQDKDRVETGERSLLHLQLDEDKYLTAEAETIFEVEAAGNVDSQDTRTKIVLNKGTVTSLIENPLGENESYEVETPVVNMAVRGTEFCVTTDSADGGGEDANGQRFSEVTVTKGLVELYRPEDEASGSAKVPAGYMLVVYDYDEDLSALEPWPIGEERPVAEVEEPQEEEEEKDFYFEFDFSQNDFTFDGEAVRPTIVQDFVEKYGVTIPFYQDGYYKSADNSVYYTGESIDVNPNGENNWFPIIRVHPEKEEIELSCYASFPQELLDRFSSPIPIGTSRDEVYRIFHADEVKQNDNKFTCNWSDNVYMLSEGDSYIDIFEIGKGSILRFGFDESDKIDRWNSVSRE